MILLKKTDFDALKTKVDSIDVSKYVLKNECDSEVGNLKLKILEVSDLLPTSTFNSKITEIEGKITTVDNEIPDISGLVSKISISTLSIKTELNNVLNKIPDITGYVKLNDYCSEITKIKNDNITKAALTSQLNNLKSQHIADEVKKIDDKAKKNCTDILGFESRLKQNEDTLNDLEREASFNRGNCYYHQQYYFLFEPKSKSFNRNGGVISSWLSTGIQNDSKNTDLVSVNNSSNNSPALLNQNNRLGVTFSGNYKKQNKLGYLHGTVINIYIVYEQNSKQS